ncbi:MAG: formylmethanofuran dehydrogenase subunit E family protein [Desulfatitalea sp.]
MIPSSAWCHDVRGTAYSFDQYRERITAFHGYPAPGLFIGGRMVDLALAAMPAGCLFNAIAETGNCLPDAIQMLTPCTIGNGWLKVLDLGRFAMALYDKHTGAGVRVYLHPAQVAAWTEIANWFFKRKPKAEQDAQKLLKEIQQAGESILQTGKIQVHPRIMTKISVGERALCPQCGESYPLKHGASCRACQGASPYTKELG